MAATVMSASDLVFVILGLTCAMAFQAMNHGQDAHVTSYGKSGVMCDLAVGAQGEAMMRSTASRGSASAFTGA